MEYDSVLAYLPHRHPMVFIDRIKELEHGKRGRGIKCIAYNEGFFPGHFPGEPIFPGALILEAMAQMAAIVMSEPPGESAEGNSAPKYLAKVKQLSFKKPVVPGDVLDVEVVVTRRMGNMAIVSGSARVGDVEVAGGEICIAG